MQLYIFHYHLNPGGVTRIIESQVESLKKLNPEQEITVVTGDCLHPKKLEQLGAKVIVHPILNYLADTKEDYSLPLSQISRIFKELILPGDILHAHNLNLGKNPLVTLVLSNMASQGINLINHAHDFAEDRPVNLSFLKKIIVEKFKHTLDRILYPKLDNYLFATLNTFDKNRLIKYGVDQEKISLLANPVVFTSSKKSTDKELIREEICNQLNANPDKKLITYPVRVIRRKNIAEFILLSVLFKDLGNWIVTQPPKNPIELVHYNQWKKFCQEEHIELFWESGNKVDFEELIIASDFCISTSIQEGFGMVYMEPWLLNTPVIGRNIPMVTYDLIESGIDFPLLYDNLHINFQGELVQIHELQIEQQMELVKKTNEDKIFADQIIEQNNYLKCLLSKVPTETIKKNKDVILLEYSLEKYGEKLDGIYKRLTK